MLNKKIGCQLYSLRDFCKTEIDLDATLKKVSDIGYKAIQVSGVGVPDARVIKALADKYNLEVICTHQNYANFTGNINTVVNYNKDLGVQIAGLGSGFYDDSLEPTASKDKYIKELKEFSKAMKDAGLTFAYHNHAFEFAKIDGKYLMDYIIEETDVKFILDTYWLAVAGQDVTEFIKKHKDRIAVLHFKDLKMPLKSNAPTMCEVGYGNLDFDAIIETSNQLLDGIFAIVEQDLTDKDAFESAKLSYDYLITKGFC